MKTLLLCLGITAGLCMGCRSVDTLPVACQPIGDIIPPGTCQTAGTGLVLTAAGLPKATNLTWVITPMKDTVIQGGQTYTYTAVLVNTAVNSVTVPDTLVDTYPKIGLVVNQKDCSRSSNLYFSFVKRFQRSTNCFVWQQQEKFVIGD